MANILKRFKTDLLLDYFIRNDPAGIILTGIVGAGKTTLIAKLCEDLEELGYQILKFDGDDVSFRTEVQSNSKIFIEAILERGFKKPLIFVDEVQKESEIFDAIKLVFDKTQASFILSGSNPSYLKTIAANRLQRRAAIFSLNPLCLSEIVLNEQLVKGFDWTHFSNLLMFEYKKKPPQLPEVTLPHKIDKFVSRFLHIGGLPLAHNATNLQSAFEQIKLTAERGITETYIDTLPQADIIRQYLARLNSQEFSYQGMFQKLRLNKRHPIDKVVDHLLNHGYIFSKRPFLEDFELKKKTYMVSHSWIDPGIVSYFLGEIAPNDQKSGFRLEAYVHTRLLQYLEHIPLKSSIYYHKPFEIRKSDQALVFLPGEIDFIVKIGEKIIPIEVKETSKIADIDLTHLTGYLKKYDRPLGIVLYGGAAFFDKVRRVAFYPYWLL